MSDVLEAARAWGKSDESLWRFAELSAPIVGRRDGDTAKLAAAIRRSSDTVESYAHAYRLYEKSLECEPALAEHWRADLSIGHYVSVAKKWRRKEQPISLDEAMDYLARSRAEGWSVEDLRKKLPGVGGGDTRQMLKRLRAFLEKDVTHGVWYDVDEKLMRRLNRLAKAAVAIIDLVIGKESAE